MSSYSSSSRPINSRRPPRFSYSDAVKGPGPGAAGTGGNEDYQPSSFGGRTFIFQAPGRGSYPITPGEGMLLPGRYHSMLELRSDVRDAEAAQKLESYPRGPGFWLILAMTENRDGCHVDLEKVLEMLRDLGANPERDIKRLIDPHLKDVLPLQQFVNETFKRNHRYRYLGIVLMAHGSICRTTGDDYIYLAGPRADEGGNKHRQSRNRGFNWQKHKQTPKEEAGRKLYLNKFFEMFTTKQCPFLNGKPRVGFVSS